MNRFGYIADDLTSLEMSIDHLSDAPHAKALKAALQRAFVEACKASRAQRLAEVQTQASSKGDDPKRSDCEKGNTANNFCDAPGNDLGWKVNSKARRTNAGVLAFPLS